MRASLRTAVSRPDMAAARSRLIAAMSVELCRSLDSCSAPVLEEQAEVADRGRLCEAPGEARPPLSDLLARCTSHTHARQHPLPSAKGPPMSYRQLLPALLLLVGIVLIAFGFRETDSFRSQFSRFFSGSINDRAMWLILGGAVAVIAAASFSRASFKNTTRP